MESTIIVPAECSSPFIGAVNQVPVCPVSARYAPLLHDYGGGYGDDPEI